MESVEATKTLCFEYIKKKKREESEKRGKPLQPISNKEIAQAFLLRTATLVVIKQDAL